MTCPHYKTTWCDLFNIPCQYRRTLTLECPIVKKDAEIEYNKKVMSFAETKIEKLEEKIEKLKIGIQEAHKYIAKGIDDIDPIENFALDMALVILDKFKNK